MKSLVFLPLCALLSSAAFAKPLSYKSPASMYKVDSTVTAGVVSYTSETSKAPLSLEKTSSSEVLGALALYNIGTSGVRVGMTVLRENLTSTSLTPAVSYDLFENVSLGTETTFSAYDEAGKNASYEQTIGAIYHIKGFETGFGFKAPLNTKKGDAYSNQFASHAKKKLTDTFSSLLEVRGTFNQEAAEKKPVVLDTKFKVENDITDHISLQAAIAYKQASFKDVAQMSTKNLQTVSYSVGADFEVTKGLLISPEIEVSQGYGANESASFHKRELASEIGVTWIL